jgi:sulfotransferase
MIHFVSSLPRSGSTLLMNFLGQNPDHYVTPTSGLVEMVVNQINSWKHINDFQAEGLDKVKPRIKKAVKGFMQGYFEDELLTGKVVFDKSRGWLQYIEDLESVLDRKVKVICNIRDVRDILASFEKLYQKRDIEYQYPVGDLYFQCQTIVGRCEALLSPSGLLGITINRLRDALNRKIHDRLILVPYSSLTEDPVDLMGLLHGALELPAFEYNPNNVNQVTHENDLVHGMDLHKIKNVISPAKKKTWEGVLPAAYADEIAQRYADINSLANAE